MNSSPKNSALSSARSSEKLFNKHEIVKQRREEQKRQKYIKTRIEEVKYYVNVIKNEYKLSRSDDVSRKNFINSNQQILLVSMIFFDSVREILAYQNVKKFRQK